MDKFFYKKADYRPMQAKQNLISKLSGELNELSR